MTATLEAESEYHDCPAPGCRKRVQFDRLACRAHWFALPAHLRAAVWSAYRRHGIGSAEHTAAIADAIAWYERGA